VKQSPTSESIPVNVVKANLTKPFSWHLLSQVNSKGIKSTYSPTGHWSFRSAGINHSLPAVFVDQKSPAVAINQELPLWLESPGILPLIDPAVSDSEAGRTVNRKDRNWFVQKLIPSVMGKTIVLDPIGGGTSSNLTAPLGLRGSDLNLATAIWTARLLKGSGADVYLTRTDESALVNEEKIRLAEQVDADLFLAIGRNSGYSEVNARHHPGSINGSAWAKYFIDAYKPLVASACVMSAVPAYDYVLRHTACPALSVRLPFPTDTETELSLGSVAFALAESRALLLSITAITGNPTALENRLQVETILNELPLDKLPLNAIERIVIDGNYPWVPLPVTDMTTGVRSSFVDSMTDPGFPSARETRHTIEIHSGSAWQVWLLDKQQNGSFYNLLLHNP